MSTPPPPPPPRPAGATPPLPGASSPAPPPPPVPANGSLTPDRKVSGPPPPLPPPQRPDTHSNVSAQMGIAAPLPPPGPPPRTTGTPPLPVSLPSTNGLSTPPLPPSLQPAAEAVSAPILRPPPAAAPAGTMTPPPPPSAPPAATSAPQTTAPTATSSTVAPPPPLPAAAPAALQETDAAAAATTAAGAGAGAASTAHTGGSGDSAATAQGVSSKTSPPPPTTTTTTAPSSTGSGSGTGGVASKWGAGRGVGAGPGGGGSSVSSSSTSPTQPSSSTSPGPAPAGGSRAGSPSWMKGKGGAAAGEGAEAKPAPAAGATSAAAAGASGSPTPEPAKPKWGAGAAGTSTSSASSPSRFGAAAGGSTSPGPAAGAGAGGGGAAGPSWKKATAGTLPPASSSPAPAEGAGPSASAASPGRAGSSPSWAAKQQAAAAGSAGSSSTSPLPAAGAGAAADAAAAPKPLRPWEQKKAVGSTSTSPSAGAASAPSAAGEPASSSSSSPAPAGSGGPKWGAKAAGAGGGGDGARTGASPSSTAAGGDAAIRPSSTAAAGGGASKFGSASATGSRGVGGAPAPAPEPPAAPTALPPEADIPEEADPVPYAVVRVDRLVAALASSLASLDSSARSLAIAHRSTAGGIEVGQGELAAVVDSVQGLGSEGERAKAWPREAQGKHADLARALREAGESLAHAQEAAEREGGQVKEALTALQAEAQALQGRLTSEGIRAGAAGLLPSSSTVGAASADPRPTPVPSDRQEAVTAAARALLVEQGAVRGRYSEAEGRARALASSAMAAQSKLAEAVRGCTPGISLLRKDTAARLSSLAKAGGLGSPLKATGAGSASAAPGGKTLPGGGGVRAERSLAEEQAEALIGFARDLGAFRVSLASTRHAAPLATFQGEGGSLDTGLQALQLQIGEVQSKWAGAATGSLVNTILGLSSDFAALKATLASRRLQTANAVQAQAEAAVRLAGKVSALRAALGEGGGGSGGDPPSASPASPPPPLDARITSVVELHGEVQGLRESLAPLLAAEPAHAPDPAAVATVQRIAGLVSSLQAALSTYPSPTPATAQGQGQEAEPGQLKASLHGAERAVRELGECLTSAGQAASRVGTEGALLLARVQEGLALILQAISSSSAPPAADQGLLTQAAAEAARKYSSSVASASAEFALLRSALLGRTPPALETAGQALDRFQEHLQSLRVAVALSTNGSARHIQAVAAMNADCHGLRQCISGARGVAVDLAPRLARHVGTAEELVANVRALLSSGAGRRQEAFATIASVLARLPALTPTATTTTAPRGEPAPMGRVEELAKAVASLGQELAIAHAAVPGREGEDEGARAALRSLSAEVSGLRQALDSASGEALLAGEGIRRAVDGLARRAEALGSALLTSAQAAEVTPAVITALKDTLDALRVAGLPPSSSLPLTTTGSSSSTPPSYAQGGPLSMSHALASVSRITEQLGALRAAVDSAGGAAGGGAGGGGGASETTPTPTHTPTLMGQAVDTVASQVARLQEALAEAAQGAGSDPSAPLPPAAAAQLSLVSRVDSELSALKAKLDLLQPGGEAGTGTGGSSGGEAAQASSSVLRAVLLCLDEVHGLKAAVADSLGSDLGQRSKLVRLASELESVRQAQEELALREAEAQAQAREAQWAREQEGRAGRAAQEDLLARAGAERRRLEVEAAQLREQMEHALAIARLQKETAEKKVELTRTQAAEATAVEVERVRTEAELQRMRMGAEIEALRKAREEDQARAAGTIAQLEREVEHLRSLLRQAQGAREEDGRRLSLQLASKDTALLETQKAASARLEAVAAEARARMEAALDAANQRLVRAREEGEAKAAEVLRRSAEQQAALIAAAEARRSETEAALVRARAEKEAAEEAARTVTSHLQERLVRAHALHESAVREIKESVQGFQLAAQLRDTLAQYESKLVGERRRVIQLERALGLPTSSPAVQIQDLPPIPALPLQAAQAQQQYLLTAGGTAAGGGPSSPAPAGPHAHAQSSIARMQLGLPPHGSAVRLSGLVHPAASPYPSPSPAPQAHPQAQAQAMAEAVEKGRHDLAAAQVAEALAAYGAAHAHAQQHQQQVQHGREQAHGHREYQQQQEGGQQGGGGQYQPSGALGAALQQVQDTLRSLSPAPPPAPSGRSSSPAPHAVVGGGSAPGSPSLPASSGPSPSHSPRGGMGPEGGQHAAAGEAPPLGTAAGHSQGQAAASLPPVSWSEQRAAEAMAGLGIERRPPTTPNLPEHAAAAVQAQVYAAQHPAPAPAPRRSASPGHAPSTALVVSGYSSSTALALAAATPSRPVISPGMDGVDAVLVASAQAAMHAHLPQGSPASVEDILLLARQAAAEASALRGAALPKAAGGSPSTTGGAGVGGGAEGAGGGATNATRRATYAKLVEYMGARAKQAQLVESGAVSHPEAAVDRLRHRERVVLAQAGDLAAQAGAIMDRLTYEAKREVLGHQAAKKAAAEAGRREAAEGFRRARMGARGSTTLLQLGAAPSTTPLQPPATPQPGPAAGGVVVDAEREAMEAEIAELERLAALGGKALAAAAQAAGGASAS